MLQWNGNITDRLGNVVRVSLSSFFENDLFICLMQGCLVYSYSDLVVYFVYYNCSLVEEAVFKKWSLLVYHRFSDDFRGNRN